MVVSGGVFLIKEVLNPGMNKWKPVLWLWFSFLNTRRCLSSDVSSLLLVGMFGIIKLSSWANYFRERSAQCEECWLTWACTFFLLLIFWSFISISQNQVFGVRSYFQKASILLLFYFLFYFSLFYFISSHHHLFSLYAYPPPPTSLTPAITTLLSCPWVLSLFSPLFA